MSDEQDGQTPKQSFPLMRSRVVNSVPRKRLPPARRDDELTVAIAKRDAQVDRLLHREFGSLAPPIPPSLHGGPSPRDAEARIRDQAIQARRKELEALHPTNLQAMIDSADAERTEQARQWYEKVLTEREKRWPHWANKDLWSEAEFAALCCGYVPEERGMPGDPGKLTGDDSQAIAVNRAADDIRRGTLSGNLAFVPRDDADTAARMYGTARHYVPAIAAEWATQRFPTTFPPSLLNAVRERAQSTAVTRNAGSDKPLAVRERNNLLRIIRALDAMNPNPLPQSGYAESVRTQMGGLGLTVVSDDTIRKAIEAARKLDS